MKNIKNTVTESHECDVSRLGELLTTADQPLLLKGLVADWPVVKKSRQSDKSVDSYLREYYQNADVQAFVGDREIKGRFFYNNDLTSLNFEQVKTRLDTILDSIQLAKNDRQPPTFYMGSTSLDYCLPGFAEKNPLPLDDFNPLVSIWVGNQTRIAAHYDIPDNIACVAAGKRRFIFFPPEQLENLYVGPLDFTPAGQPVSLVDFQNPDFDRFPKFAEALKHAKVAELEPGDAIFIPSMWWHYVESLGSLNVLVNYWWRKSADFMGLPSDALMHAMLSVRDLPRAQRAAWKKIFDYYVFDADENTASHIPEKQRGSLALNDEVNARRMRAMLLNRLNR